MAKASTERLAERLSLLEDVIEHLPIGVIIVDRHGKILLMNRWQEKISRIRREQVLGSYFHEKWERLFSQGIMSEYWKLLEDGTPFHTILHDVYPQFYDQKISAISRGAPLEGHQAFILLHDVSLEIQADKHGLERLTKQLADQTSFLTNLIDSSPNLVITTDEGGRMQSINRTGEKTLGYDKFDLVGRNIKFIFLEPKDVELLTVAARTGRPVEVRCRKKTGPAFPARAQVRDIHDNRGQVQAKLYLLTDITHEKNMEEKLALSEKLAIYSELMAGIAHQLNNPLVGVANFSSLLLDKIGPADPNRAIAETIFEAARKCQTMLSTMIKSLREPSSTFHRVDLADVLEQALKDVFLTPPTGNVVVEKVIPDKLPPVRGDAIQLLEVFRNLLVNALQAMPENGHLGVHARADHQAREILVEVADTGPGVPSDLVEKIFEPFFTTKKNTGGGLGLSFAFRVVKNHGGRIDVRPARPQGSIFIVALPVSRLQPDQ